MQQPREKLSKVVQCGILCMLCWFVPVLLVEHAILGSNEKNSDQNVVSPALLMADEGRSLQALWVDDSQNEPLFEAIGACFRSEECLGSGVADYDGSPTRVALLVSPGRLGNIFVQYIKDILQTRFDRENADDMLIIPTTHLLTKDDHYSHAIRFATLPLLLSVGDALLSVIQSDAEDFSMDDIQQTTEILLEWHCGISRMADTIPTLTLTMQQLVDDPIESEDALGEFLQNLKVVEDLRSSGSGDTVTEPLSDALADIESALQHVLHQQIENHVKNPTSMKADIDEIIHNYFGGQNECPSVAEPMTAASPIARRLLPFLAQDSVSSDDPCEGDTVLFPHCKDREKQFRTDELPTELDLS